MIGSEAEENMDLEKLEVTDERKGILSISCSICLESVSDRGKRSVAKLECGHEFHLDCIGSAFNAKGAMQCPNCRKVEKGRWLFANGVRPSTDFDLDSWITENIYDLSYSELPFGLQWCPIRGFTRLTAMLEDGESQLNSYHEPLGGNALGDISSASISIHDCPYVALHQAMHTAHSNTPISVPDTASFHQPLTNLVIQPPAERLNTHNFSATEASNSNWSQLSAPIPIPLAGGSDHAASPFGLRLHRNNTVNQQIVQPRLGSFVHAHPLLPGSIATRSGTNLLASSMGPPILREVRAHTRGHGQPVSSSTRSSSFAPLRRSRPRGLALISTSSSADIGGLYGFSVSSSTSRSLQDSDRRYFSWGREGFTPLPWIPVEGESQWWGPFNPNHAPQFGSFLQRGGTSSEIITQNHSDSGYHQQMQLPPWMPPPPPYM